MGKIGKSKARKRSGVKDLAPRHAKAEAVKGGFLGKLTRKAGRSVATPVRSP